MSFWQKLFGSKQNISGQLESKVDARPEGELWALRLKETRDWLTLAAIFNSNNWDKRNKYSRFARKVVKRSRH